MRVFHYHLLLEGKNSSISRTRRNEVQGLVTKDSHWWSCLGLISHQTIGWHESDLYFMTEKQQTNKSTWGIERLESSSWSWKSHEVGEALAKLNKTPGNKEWQQQNGLRFWKKHRTWSTNMRVEEWTLSLLAVTPTLSSTPNPTLEKVSMCITRQSSLQNTSWVLGAMIVMRFDKNGENGPSYQREEFLPSDVLSGPSC